MQLKLIAVVKTSAPEYPVQRILEAIEKLAGEEAKDGARVALGGYPATLKDNVANGEICLIAVDKEAAKNIKGLLMKDGLTGTIESDGLTICFRTAE